MDTQHNQKTDSIPEIYSAISISFKENTDLIAVIRELKQIGICDFKIQKPRYTSSFCIDIAIIKYVQSWELNDIITKMFFKINNQLLAIKKIINHYEGETYIDVAVYHHGTLPAIVIHKNNIRKINYLKANISIDVQG